MSVMLPYIILGVLAGILSGVVGIGGGIVIVPALVFMFGMSQLEAQGTTLALLIPPIGILAAWTYYTHGYVNIKIALLIIAGFLVGGLIGGKIAVGLPNEVLQKVFGAFLLIVSVKMLMGK